jgi:pimeloyl-ACP methyl ester carboxylesterase
MTERHETVVVDGEAVVAVHHPAPSDRWLVFCHGFLSDKSGSYEGRCRRAVREGYNAVRFDFRGCGESEGAFIDQTLGHKLADLAAVIDHFDPATCALFGSSFGGKVTFHTAAGDDRIGAVVARAPVTFNRAFDGYRDIVAEERTHELEDGRRIDRRFFADLDRYPFERAADAVDAPVAIFHGASDGSVPVEDSLEAACRLDTDVLVEKFADEGHRFSEDAERRMRDRLFGWLTETV